MLCRGCGLDKKLIDSHIIPKSFFMNLKGESNHLNVVGTDAPGMIGRSFKGEYDKEILCSDCDGSFQKYDNYAKTFFVDMVPTYKEIIQAGDVVGWEVEEFDYELLSKFVLSALWRASISKRKYYCLVDLGPHEELVKQELFKENKKNSRNYEFLISRYLPDKIPNIEKTMISPDYSRLEGVNFTRIFFLGFTLWIKVDKRVMPSPFSSYMICENKAAKIVARTFGSSKEWGLMVKAHNG